jgi:D-alanyl-D-alanine carboxypeptidase (penicillin-binding protein 5/6)
MYKLILAAFLLLLGPLPNTDLKLTLERNIRDRVDLTSETKPETTLVREISAVEYIDGFRERTALSKAAYFVDVRSGQVLLQKQADKKLPMASITKLMTALVVMEELDPSEIVSIPRNDTRADDSTAGFVYGDRLSVYNLLQGLLINSGSDAALTLAKHTSGNEEKFVAVMNERATLLGLENTQFTNPVGWDETGHYSTTHDLSVLTRVALSNPTIKQIVAKKTARVVSENNRTYILTNTNLLLGTRFRGAKTGTTYEAGACLASYYKDEEKEIVGVILDSPGRFAETEDIINWINNNFQFHYEDGQTETIQ